jgi:replicative DNA helicase
MKTENLDIEYSLIFAIFKYGEDAFKIYSDFGIDFTYFSNIVHQDIFKCLFDDFDKNKTVLSISGFYKYYSAISTVTAEDKTKCKAALENIKKNPVVLKDLKKLCKQFVTFYTTRQTLKSLNESVDILDSGKVDEALDKIERDVRKARTLLNPQMVNEVIGLRNGLKERQDLAYKIKNDPNAVGMIETGFINFDKYIGKQHPGQLVLYQSRTNMGKSMFLKGTALHNWQRGRKVIVVTIEMSHKEYGFRMDSHITRIEHSQFSQGEITEDLALMQKWDRDVSDYSKCPEDLLIYWVPSNCTPKKLRDIIRNNPFEPDLVVVDYAGDMKAGLRGVPDYDPVAHAEIYSCLKESAGEFNTVLYSAQQTKRGQKKLSTESGSWSDVASNKADIMIAIECTREDEDFLYEENGVVYQGRLTLSIVKGRNIPKCRTHIIPDFKRMSWLEKESEEMIAADFQSKETDKKKRERQAENLENDMEKEDMDQNPSEEEELEENMIPDY